MMKMKFLSNRQKTVDNGYDVCYFIIVKLTKKKVMTLHNHLQSDQIYVTVDLIILTIRENRLNVLLSPRRDWPYEGFWALPGRFVDSKESAETAAGKLLQEMLPLQNVFLEQLYTYTEVERDPRGRVISVAYLVISPYGQIQKLLCEHSLTLQCFEVHFMEQLRLESESGLVLDEQNLAFDHGRILRTGLMRVRNKIEYTEIGFQFLESREEFTLVELQKVFEAVLGSTLDGGNFRRGILAKYGKTGQIAETDYELRKGRGRPAVLYCFRNAVQKSK